MKILLACGVKINGVDSKGRTALHYACLFGNFWPANCLLKFSKCDVDATDSELNTPLILATKFGNKNLVRLLLSKGANKSKM